MIAWTYDRESVNEWAGDSQWRAFRADLARFRAHGYSGWGSEGLWMLAIHRAQVAVQRVSPRLLTLPLRVALGVMRKLLTMITHISLHPSAHIGPGMLIPHVGPIQVAPGSSIGADCSLHHVCTVGAGSRPGMPTIGDHVMMGAHSMVLGPVRVGAGAIVAAGAVVVKDVPPGVTVAGVPAKPVSATAD